MELRLPGLPAEARECYELLRSSSSGSSAACEDVGRRMPSSQQECEAAARVWAQYQCNPGYNGMPQFDLLHCRRLRYANDLGSEVSVWSNNDCWNQLYPRCAFFHNYNDGDSDDVTRTRLYWAPRCGDNPLLERNDAAGTDANNADIEILCV